MGKQRMELLTDKEWNYWQTKNEITGKQRMEIYNPQKTLPVNYGSGPVNAPRTGLFGPTSK